MGRLTWYKRSRAASWLKLAELWIRLCVLDQFVSELSVSSCEKGDDSTVYLRVVLEIKWDLI